MSTKKILPCRVSGSLAMPPSKSVSHRMIIAAALSEGTSTIRGVLLSDDIRATVSACEALGAKISYTRQPRGLFKLSIVGCAMPKAAGKTIDCLESGSTLRFLIPIAGLDAKDTRFIGRGRLPERPLGPYHDAFAGTTLTLTKPDSKRELPLTLSGKLKHGVYHLPGDVSSQFVTGLLLALPLVRGNSEIIIDGPLESAPYVDITLDVMAAFGVRVDCDGHRRFIISGGQRYQSSNLTVPGDWSQAAFFAAMASFGGALHLTGLRADDVQGDRVIVDILRQMGGRLAYTKRGLFVSSSDLRGIDIDVSACPDLVPILAVIGAAAKGTTRIVGAGRLRLKESDRLAAVTDTLSRLGATIQSDADSVRIDGGKPLFGGKVDAYNDHRIVMAMTAAASLCAHPVIIDGAEAVAKSYPDFFSDYKTIGGAAL